MPLRALNLTKPAKKPTGPPKPKKPLSAFATAESDSEGEPPAGVFGGAKGKVKPKAKSKGKDISTVNAQLATFNEISRKAEEAAAKAAAEVDSSVYDYDGVWEDMKSVDRKKKELDQQDAVERKPKYMENLLVAADIRKRDQLRAKEKLLQREREAEGEEFMDKESFVTEAYKKQQEELLRLEEEERIREEKLKKKSQGMSTFHRNMLNKMESKHDAVVAAAENKDKRPNASESADKTEETEIERRARELREKGAVEINEEGQLVDKTQLLSGGLNLLASKSSAPDPRSVADPRRTQPGGSLARDKRQQQMEMRARQSKMLEEQLLQAQKRQLEEDQESKAELERQTKSRKTEADVSSARERYLARKAAALKEKP